MDHAIFGGIKRPVLRIQLRGSQGQVEAVFVLA